MLCGAAALLSACGSAPSCLDVDCDDASVCTADRCSAEGECVNEPLEDGTQCQISGAAGSCLAGACATLACASLQCDDGNPCTVNACFPATDQCTFFEGPAFEPCEVDGRFGRCLAGECDFNLLGPSEVQIRLELVGADAASMSYALQCAGNLEFTGTLTGAERAWQVLLRLPAGTCTALFTAFTESEVALCDQTLEFEVLPEQGSVVETTIPCAE